MSEYRVRSTGQVLSQGAIRKLNRNMSLPRVWTQNTLEALGIDPVFATPKPATTGDYKTVVRNGVEQDAKGNWVYAWVERDMFQKYTDEDGVTHTKAEQEAAYQSDLDNKAAESVRTQRDNLLSETDWMALSDNTLTPEWATYRQALRDITDNPKFPWLEDADWPAKPE